MKSDPDQKGSRMDSAVTLEAMEPQFDEGALEDLRERLRRTRRPTPAETDWARGVPAYWLGSIIDDWMEFDVAEFARRLTGFEHLRVTIGRQSVHVLTVPGRGDHPVPLLLANGWPSTFCEYLDLIPLLTDPGAHGGDPADAFTVIVPTMPGFGFSSPPPPGGLTAAQVAELWHTLMTQGMGHQRYVAHGSDLGAGVIAQLARLHPNAVAAIHLATPGLPMPPEPWSAAEEAYAAEAGRWAANEGSYAHQHATKPATVGVGLNDSPAGLAAWIGEKTTAWSGLTSAGQSAFPRELLLANLTIYWMTGSVGSSMLPYWSYQHAPHAALSPAEQSPVPTAVSVFAGESVPFPKIPRGLAERFFNIADWQEHDRGGHFPAAEVPQELAAALRRAFRPFRLESLLHQR